MYTNLETGASISRQSPRRLPGFGAVLLIVGLVVSVLWMRPSDDYDCDGDGVNECGVYDYERGECANKDRCGRFYRNADLTLGHTCRCRRCVATQFEGSAFGDPVLTHPPDDAPFEALSWGKFKNWGDHLETCAPWLMPKDEASIKTLLHYAKMRNYKVRVGGTGYSAGGLVTDGANKQVLVISLGEFASSDVEWQFGLRILPDGSARATVNAGWTLLHLFSRIRPHGYFLPTVTAGYYFSLGGIVANSVHGGGYNSGFIYSYVTRMRVMLHDGRIRVFDSEEDLRYWRGSMGLLGVILGVEFQLVKRDQLQMYTVSQTMENWSAEELWKFIKNDAEADVPIDIVPQGGRNGTRSSWNALYFVDFVNGGDQPKIMAYAQKTNASIDEDFTGQLGLPEDAAQNYRDMLDAPVSLEGHGSMPYETATRRDGSPPLAIAGMDVNKVLSSLNWLPLAKSMAWSAIVDVPMFVSQFRSKVNDGFMQLQTPDALAAAFYFEPKDVFKALDFLRTVQLESLESQEFVWNLPAEFRFVNITDNAVLQPVPAGLRIAVEMTSFEELSRKGEEWKRSFKKVEDFWVDSMGSTPHLGKIWGFVETVDGTLQPFQRSRSCTIFSDVQKAEFEKYRSISDPSDLFFSGLGKEMLAPCSGTGRAM